MPAMVSYSHRLKSGHLTCYLNRTYHVLTTSAAFLLTRRTPSHIVQSSYPQSCCGLRFFAISPSQTLGQGLAYGPKRLQSVPGTQVLNPGLVFPIDRGPLSA